MADEEVIIEFECREDDHSVAMSYEGAIGVISTIVCEYDGTMPTPETYADIEDWENRY